MEPRLEQQLVDKYPNLYKNFHGDPLHTCMAWGFDCGSGWYDLIDELSAILEPLGVVANQVKQKYGTLRFYVDLPDNIKNPNVYQVACKAIEEAEKKSATICEYCGNPGKAVGASWIITVCDECAFI